MNEWVKKRRERRKVSGEGQTYDLPKNGNLLFDFFPSLYSKWASLETQGQLVGTKWYFWAVQHFRVGEPLGTGTYIILLLNQLQKHSSTFARKYCVAWKYRVSWLANWVSKDAKWAESKYCCMIIVQLSLKKLITCMFFIEIRRCSSFAYASKQRQRSLQVSTVCHSITVIKSWTKKTKVRLHLPIYIYIYGKIQKRSLAKSTMYIKTQAFDCLFTAWNMLLAQNACSKVCLSMCFIVLAVFLECQEMRQMMT